ncbi:hypothetical protein [Halomonas sp. YLGW01]|uniref:hypothetical protein n=1 Tax=Halomonas sp. YLGW01 TaxID=2773308 RepID=UPI00178597F7|nr:hypothetical protein [Halomonas sp. YLGW01]
MRSLSILARAGMLSLLPLSAMAKEPIEEEPWPVKLVSHFEAFCYQTDASFPKAVALANVLEKQEIPSEMMAAFMPLNDVDDAKGYLLERDDVRQRAIFLGVVTGKDACSVAGTGISQDEVIASMSENYRLREVASTDIGLQISTMYIPGGTSDATREAHRKGMIAITKGKSGATAETMTLAYIPPRTAKETF